jgi:hypothetical protein
VLHNKTLRRPKQDPHHKTRVPNPKGKGICSNEKPRQGSTYLHHGLLILTVFYLGCGQVNNATLHWVLVTVIDEDIRAADHNKMLSPVVGKWFLEVQVSFLRDH